MHNCFPRPRSNGKVLSVCKQIHVTKYQKHRVRRYSFTSPNSILWSGRLKVQGESEGDCQRQSRTFWCGISMFSSRESKGHDAWVLIKKWCLFRYEICLQYPHSGVVYGIYAVNIDSASIQHDDIIKWKHFPRYWPFVRGIHRSPVNSPHKGQWRGTFIFSLICVWIIGWVNNRDTGHLRRYSAHYDAIVVVNAVHRLCYVE